MALFTGTNGEDSIIGSLISDRIEGLGGNDTLRGWDGNDTLIGGLATIFWMAAMEMTI